MIGVLDQGLISILVLLDLSAAFDTVDHTILLDVERARFEICDRPLHWLSNFLPKREHIVRFNSSDSDDITPAALSPKDLYSVRSVLPNTPKMFRPVSSSIDCAPTCIRMTRRVSNHGYFHIDFLSCFNF
jgi:hypothetical protein